MGESVRRKANRKGGAPAQASPPLGRERLVVALVCLLLAAMVFVVFGQTVRHEFVNYDDDQYVYENPQIANGLSWGAIHWAFTHPHAQNWHPLTTLSHLLDCQLYGLQPWGPHLTNVLLHAATAILLFFALRKLTDKLWPSAVVAALFAIHPLRAGSVAWIAERKDVLSGLFFMLVLWSYARYARSERRSLGRYLTVVVLFALGLMSKPTLVTVPFVLLLLDYWPLRRFSTGSFGSLLVEKIPFFLLSVGSSVATLMAQGKALIAMRQLSVEDRVANALVSYVAYVGQLFWPVNLAVVYPFPEGGWSLVQAALALAVLLAVTGVFFIWREKYPYLLVGWLWFLGMLVPMIGVVQVGIQARADRYTYLTQIGLLILLIWGAAELLARWRYGRVGFIILAPIIAMALMADAYFQTTFWRNSETLWTRAIAVTSNNFIALNNLGDAVMKKPGRLDEALLYLRKSLEISPEYPDANNNLGYVLASKGQWDDAIVAFQAALRVRPNFPQAHSNMAVSLSNLGKTDDALAELQEALRINENYAEGHRNIAVLLLKVGRRDEAVIHFREALRLKPDDKPVRDQLRQLGAEG